jgi:two-component system, NarL family, nitrate/nitrite response regulator NarL
MNDMIRVAAIDDHLLFLQGLRRALSQAPDLLILGDGSTATDACRIATEDKPDILLLDLDIPGSGIAAARTINARAPQVKIIVMTGSSEDDDVSEAFAVGAKGYLLKGAGAAELLDAIRAVHRGRPYITQELASRLIVQSIGKRPSSANNEAFDRLNDRERLIIRHATEGLTNNEIALRMGLPTRIVRYCISSILRKCGVRNRLEAILMLENSIAGRNIQS